MKTTITRIIFAVLSLIICCVMVFTLCPEESSASANYKEIKLPVLMYHHIMEKGKLIGDYCITPSQFEEDLKYIKDKGYTTVSADDLLEFYYNKIPLPEKPIMITFDDGYESSYVYAFPLLKKYNMKAIISIIGNYSDLYSTIPSSEKDVSYSHITWDQAKIMQNSKLIEIGNHTYNLHSIEKGRKGVVKKNDNGFYNGEMKEDILKLQKKIEENLGMTPVIFAYPFGSRNEKTDKIIKDIKFKVVLGCEEKVNILTGTNKEELYNIKRFNRPHNIKTEDFFKKFEN